MSYLNARTHTHACAHTHTHARMRTHTHTHTHAHSDGTISYEELLSYFLSANTSLRQRFTHKFEEHTFLSSPVCAHCKGMVSLWWGCEGESVRGVRVSL